jgi:hypothetical protein
LRRTLVWFLARSECSAAEAVTIQIFLGIIAQAPLPSYNHRVPDFLWLSRDSDTDQPVLIEIEAPSKKWFTKAGAPTAGFTQALNQIAEWKSWFSIGRNLDAFKAFIG